MMPPWLAVIGEEAPSSISGGDQLRAAVVLGACLLAMALLAALAVRQGRRRQRDRSRRDGGPQDGLKSDRNGHASRRPD
ncbi:MAG: hypothetical protein M3011_14190 [Actinomycetota bacterium]|nr:hypothetical protein [Actinomycetota bacterium]